MRVSGHLTSGQGVHAAAPAADVNPSGQGRHAVALFAAALQLNRPAPQASQRDWPGRGCTVPCAHGWHCSAPACETKPARKSTNQQRRRISAADQGGRACSERHQTPEPLRPPSISAQHTTRTNATRSAMHATKRGTWEQTDLTQAVSGQRGGASATRRLQAVEAFCMHAAKSDISMKTTADDRSQQYHCQGRSE